MKSQGIYGNLQAKIVDILAGFHRLKCKNTIYNA